MIKKNWEVSTKGVASYSYRKLNQLNEQIEKIEWNYFKRVLGYRTLRLLKDYKRFVENSIERDKNHLIARELSSMHSSEVDEIIKENKRLEKEIKKGKELGYISKREENHWNQKRRRGRPRKNF